MIVPASSCVSDEFGIEARQVEVVERLLDAHRHVVKPSHALVALRTVGRDAVQVARFGGLDHLVDAVQQLVAATERAGLGYGVADDAYPDVAFGGRLGQSLDLNVAEAVVGEDRKSTRLNSSHE